MNDVENSSKCCSYKQFKTSFKLEKYLTCLPRDLRGTMSKFRLSSNRLPIELGRHNGISRCHRSGADLEISERGGPNFGRWNIPLVI